MTRPSLADITQRAAAATEGPWEATQDKCWGETYPSLTIQRVYEYTDYDPAHAGCEPLDAEDVEFIAHARTDVPAMSAAIRDVLALHREGSEALDYDAEGVLDYLTACDECGLAFPCLTVRAVTAHIDTTPKETP